ncbi:MAG TPA: ACP phosphodiesterase [Thermodesulfobacteriota bacterium]|nr:ACP phosphodiesterase [Thermodesulfobacteriota bacterium]
MNYLAHMYLAGDSEESLVGNMLGDFVKGRIGDEFPPGVAEGIRTHRKIDAFTDSHERVISSKRLVSRERRRFSGIIVDLAFDHILALNWGDYSELPLGDFIQRTYSLLAANAGLMPPRPREVLRFMIEEDWLGSYRRLDGIGRALDRIAVRVERRFGRKNSLPGAVDEISRNYNALEENFRAFFPELVSFVEEYSKGTQTNQR